KDCNGRKNGLRNLSQPHAHFVIVIRKYPSDSRFPAFTGGGDAHIGHPLQDYTTVLHEFFSFATAK
ncbi:hypothetical protein, partial [Alistipes finegoldii]|uniref:hypothetical protein n=1 Tax=Alistipes finegoldii TaxID=214856 RepID=UPI0025ADA321